MTDDELRAVLRAADPARDLPPLTRDHLDAKAEQTMTTEAPARPAAPRQRRTRILIGAGVAVAAAAVVIGVVGRGDPATTRLTVSGTDVTASCAVLTPDVLAGRETAFAARVVSITQGEVVLEVTHRFKGSVTDEVRVDQPEDALAEAGPGPFAGGGDYLVSADGGRLTGCGLTGPASPELESLYEQAFG